MTAQDVTERAAREFATLADGLRDRWLNRAGASEARLKKRILINLFNSPPTWLANAHCARDAAVFAAYGWPHDLSDDAILERAAGVTRSGERAGS